MAGLISGPKAPTQPEVLFVPQNPVARPTPPFGGGSASANAGAGAGNQGSQDPQTDQGRGESAEQQAEQARKASEQRAANLLTSQRGRRGTIRTSFSGILEERDTEPRRKTLLGQ